MFPGFAFPPFAFPRGAFPGFPPAEPPIYLFTDQMAGYLAEAYGISAYPNRLPSRDTAFPLLSFTVVSGVNFMILGGACSLASIAIQFDAYSPSSYDAEILSERVRLAFQDFRGPMGFIEVSNCIAGNPRSGASASIVGSGEGMERASRDFKFWYYR